MAQSNTETNRAPASEPIPPGCWRNRDGHYVPLSLIEDYEKLREETIRPRLEYWLWLHQEIADLKASFFADIETLEDICLEQHGVRLAGKKKGNVSLYTYDGELMVQRRYQDRSQFNESIGAAEQLIREFLADLKGDAEPEVVALINIAFERTKQGEIRRSMLVKLRTLKFKDTRWMRAMEIIAQAEEIIDSACYLAVHRRAAQREYVPVPLDIAAIKPRKHEFPVPSPREWELLQALRTAFPYFNREALKVMENHVGTPSGEQQDVKDFLAEHQAVREVLNRYFDAPEV